MARKYKFCFVMLSQMTRESEKREEPMLSDLKGVRLNRTRCRCRGIPFWHNGEKENNTKVIRSYFAKGRNVGENRFKYKFEWWVQRYVELPKKGGMTMGKRIENEEQYQNSLKWLVSKSLEIEDPLLDEETRKKMLQTYDFVSQRVIEYRRGELARCIRGYTLYINSSAGTMLVRQSLNRNNQKHQRKNLDFFFDD
ncbi:hypothetical protein P7H15_25620 [Paenibacillus larvae]|nr:hypothetical protein [Paenibacillus larvae]MDT2295507.1 hypothetical protein [Paenibacillus larvae]